MSHSGSRTSPEVWLANWRTVGAGASSIAPGKRAVAGKMSLSGWSRSM